MKYSLFVVLILTTATVSCVTLEEVYSWKYVDYIWDNEKQKETAINSNKYNPLSCVLYDVDRAPDGRIFVTAVREEGVPASLMTVSSEKGPGGPLLAPYPDWSWYNDDGKNCNKNIISVYRVSIKCNHLFVLDCGKIGETIKCPPKLLIFDLKNNMLVKSIRIPPGVATNENGTGLFVTPLAYVRDCDEINDVTVFMADIEGDGLVIYNGDFCRIESTFMKPTDPNFTIQNQSFSLPQDGILGLTIIHKELFYSPLSGNEIYKMDICNKQKCLNLNETEADKLTQLAGTLSGQTAPIASEKCAIFFSNIPETSILCKDATKEFNSTNSELIAQDSEKLQFPSGLKVTNHGTMLMTLTNRFQRVMTNTLNLNETNFRILTMNMMQIMKDTNCFASCDDSEQHKHRHDRPWHRGPWHRRPWHRGPWPRGPWFREPWPRRPW